LSAFSPEQENKKNTMASKDKRIMTKNFCEIMIFQIAACQDNVTFHLLLTAGSSLHEQF